MLCAASRVFAKNLPNAHLFVRLLEIGFEKTCFLLKLVFLAVNFCKSFHVIAPLLLLNAIPYLLPQLGIIGLTLRKFDTPIKLVDMFACLLNKGL